MPLGCKGNSRNSSPLPCPTLECFAIRVMQQLAMTEADRREQSFVTFAEIVTRTHPRSTLRIHLTWSLQMPLSNPGISPDQFIADVASAGPILEGFVTYDPALSDIVLFGTSPLHCPDVQIPKALITRMQCGAECRCYGRTGRMWNATVELKKATSDDGKLLEQILHNFIYEVEDSCACSTTRSDARTLASCSSYRETLERDFPEENGESSWRRSKEYNAGQCAGGDPARKLVEYTKEGARYAADRGWSEIAFYGDIKVCSNSKCIVLCGYRRI